MNYPSPPSWAIKILSGIIETLNQDKDEHIDLFVCAYFKGRKYKSIVKGNSNFMDKLLELLYQDISVALEEEKNEYKNPKNY